MVENPNMTQEELITKIIGLELEMRHQVKNKNPNSKLMVSTFKTMRGMSHSVLSRKTLESYCQDLISAKSAGRNLMIEKYARMDNLIPLINDNPLIRKIVEQEQQWLKIASQRYPVAIRGDAESIEKFAVYATSELETYSNRTLELYAQDIFAAARVGRNLVEERYTNLYIKLGFNSIADVERQVCKEGEKK